MINVYDTIDKYERPNSNFNPTLHPITWIPEPYNYEGLLSLGLLPSIALSQAKYKFVLYNSNLTVIDIDFYET